MISIVLPTYNRERVLPRAVDSVLRQSYSDWELIIVDDGSTDGTTRYLAGLDDPRITTYTHTVNRGVAAAKNTGLDHVRGEWFTILDSDDEAVPDALATMADYAARTGTRLITCNCVEAGTGKLTGSGPPFDCWLSFEQGMKLSGEHWGMVSTSLLGDLRFDERLPGWEGILWLKVDSQTRRFFVHRPLRIYHTEGGDRVSVLANRAPLAEKVAVFRMVGEDRTYLRLLRGVAPAEYRRIMMRVWAARILGVTLVRSRGGR